MKALGGPRPNRSPLDNKQEAESAHAWKADIYKFAECLRNAPGLNVDPGFFYELRNLCGSFSENFQAMESENHQLKVMLKDLYNLHVNDKSTPGANNQKENSSPSKDSKSEAVRARYHKELLELKSSFGGQIKKQENELAEALKEIIRTKQKYKARLENQKVDLESKLKKSEDERKTQLAAEASKALENSQISQKLILSLQREKKTMQLQSELKERKIVE